MLVEPISGAAEISSSLNPTKSSAPADSAQNGFSTQFNSDGLSPSAEQQLVEQNILTAANNGLTPSAAALQAEQRIAAAAFQNMFGPPTGSAAATLWQSALALIGQ